MTIPPARHSGIHGARTARSSKAIVVASLGRVISTLLILFYGVSILIATFFVYYEVRLIVLSGPILSLAGLALTLLSLLRHRPIGCSFGLLLPTASVLIFFLIVTFRWGPYEAEMPVKVMAVILTLVSIPACVAALREVENDVSLQRQRPLQFGISTLLWLMLFVALFFSFFRMGSYWGVALVVFGGYAFFVWRLLHEYRSDSRTQEAMMEPQGETSTEGDAS